MNQNEIDAQIASADARHSRATAHIAYALIYELLVELEKESPGLRKRVWENAQRSLAEYNILDEENADWLLGKIANL